MRILMLDNEYPPIGGGTGVVNQCLLEQLARHRDVEVDLLTSSGTGGSETRRVAERITIHLLPVRVRNYHHSTVPELLHYAWRATWFGRRLVRERAHDLSFAFSGVPAGFVSHALHAMTGLPFVVSLQGPDVPGFESRYRRIYPALAPIVRRQWRRAAAVTAISETHRRLALDTSPDLDVPIIPNGVDTAVFRPRSRLGDRDVVRVVCVGRLIERKGQHHLLAALRGLAAAGGPAVEVVLVGTGDAEAALRALAATLGVADLVRFEGLVSRVDMPRVYHDADVFVLPSESEGMSIALLEAMASGLPVVVTDTGGTAELVREGENGLIVPWADPDALARAIARLARDAARRERMGAVSRRMAEAFGWEAVAERYLALCARVATAPSAPGRSRQKMRMPRSAASPQDS